LSIRVLNRLQVKNSGPSSSLSFESPNATLCQTKKDRIATALDYSWKYGKILASDGSGTGRGLDAGAGRTRRPRGLSSYPVLLFFILVMLIKIE
jgi:hypothetical protein